VIRKLDKDNLDTTLATYDIGDIAGGDVTGISVFGTEIYVSGSTSSGSLNGGSVTNSYSGGKDGFVTKLSVNGSIFSADWTAYLGTSSTDSVAGIATYNGSIYAAGTTGGTLAGETRSGLTDGFTAKIDATSGAIEWQEQLSGSTGYNASAGIAVATNGSSALDKLGLPSGTINNTETRDLNTQTSLRVGDHFYISVNEGRNIKIDIREGDTFERLATRINTLSTRNLKTSVSYGEDGPALKLEAKNGATVDLIAGSDGRDALKKFGFEERSILASEILFDLDTDEEIDPEKLGGVFALNLNNAFSFNTRQEAEYIFTQLENALQVIESAHRSLTFDPVRAQILQDARKNIGPAPAHIQAQLDRYKDCLQKLLAVTGGSII
jgi:trimeric autotransporter adhesin